MISCSPPLISGEAISSWSSCRLTIFTVTLRDVSLDERLNGKTGMRIIIQKQSGANTVQVCQDIQTLMPELMKSLPEDVEIITFLILHNL